MRSHSCRYSRTQCVRGIPSFRIPPEVGMLAHPGSFSSAELLAGLAFTPDLVEVGLQRYATHTSWGLPPGLRPPLRGDDVGRASGFFMSLSPTALIATADPPPTARKRAAVAPSGSSLKSPLPARLQRVGGRASPPTEALAARSLCFRACGQTSVGSPTSCTGRGGPPRFDPPHPRRQWPLIVGRVSTRGTWVAPRTPRPWRVVGPPGYAPSPRFRR